jgi:oligopeptide transport system ATP-binding protein
MTAGSAGQAAPILRVEDLQVVVRGRKRPLRVVDGFHLDVFPGRVTGVAGESGSGKTISMMSVLGLLPLGVQASGVAWFGGRDLLSLPREALNGIRGKDIALVMQDPRSSLHPMLSVGAQLTDHLRHHFHIGKREARGRAADLLHQVRIPDPIGSLNAYPHEFSGGMCQRICIAIALACGPKILIADEPTTGLDVTVQAGILHLLRELGEAHGLGIVLITHDLGVMSGLADTVSVMYAGRIVESGPTSIVLTSPRHPYTHALLAALPRPDRSDQVLTAIPGHLGPPHRWPQGCGFHPRCPYRASGCSEVVPDLVAIGSGQQHACLVDPLAPT